MTAARILIVEDESIVQLHLRRLVERLGYVVTGLAATAEAAIASATEMRPDLVLMDIELRGRRDGIEAAKELKARFDLSVVFLTAYADEKTVKRTESVGAVGYIVKPFSEDEVRAVVGTAIGIVRKLSAPRERRASWRPGPPKDAAAHDFHGMVGRSPVMKAVFARIEELAAIDWTVLIEGETGTGKEIAARAIRELSQRSDRPFVAVNCAGLTDSILSSQLFGHRRGAFTGAVDDQVGLFEAAHTGILFLDEIADVSTGVQKSLLRVLEDGQVRRVGDTATRAVDVRILSATQRSLLEEVAAGTFRADLLYRLRAARLSLPPLRERGNDIALLADVFAADASRKAGRSVRFISEEALEKLRQHPWPGNVRELKNAIDHAVLACPGETIESTHLPSEVLDGTTDSADGLPTGDERERLRAALERTGGNRAKAARLLGISRATLYRRLDDLDVDP